MNCKQQYVAWRRSTVLFVDVHQQLEKELERMKEKKLLQDFIDQKDTQIESMVTFYNETEELIETLRAELRNSQMENHFLTEILAKKLTVQDVMSYKPSARVVIADIETGNSQTLSQLNGQD